MTSISKKRASRYVRRNTKIIRIPCFHKLFIKHGGEAKRLGDVLRIFVILPYTEPNFIS